MSNPAIDFSDMPFRYRVYLRARTLGLSAHVQEFFYRIDLESQFARVTSVGLLLPYKDGDANVRSVWLCSRNDAIGNIVVMVAAFGVWGTATAWPDLTVAAIMAGIFLTSSIQILRQALGEYRQAPMPAE